MQSILRLPQLIPSSKRPPYGPNYRTLLRRDSGGDKLDSGFAGTDYQLINYMESLLMVKPIIRSNLIYIYTEYIGCEMQKSLYILLARHTVHG